jgi:hypothetical protein
MTDWKRPLARGPRVPHAPERFRGTLRQFVDDHLERALPRPDVAIAWHEAVVAHAALPGSTLLVRSTPGFKQENETSSLSGRVLRMTDNAPPWWMHAVAFSGLRPPASGLSGILDDVWCWMFRAHKGGTVGPGQANAAGWYVAHILRAKPDGDGSPERWDDAVARRRFIRNFSPLNQFLVPKGNGKDIGERAVVISTIAEWYRSRFGDRYSTFLDEAGVRRGEIGRADWSSVVELHSGQDADEPDAPAPVPTVRAPTPARTNSMRGALPAPWRSVLEPTAGRDRRAAILGATPDAPARLARLVGGLTVPQFVGLANAIYNKCDPTDVEGAAPGNAPQQARIAWSFLDDAKARPRLGGKWAKTVDVLTPGGDSGLAAARDLGLDAFVAASLRVVSHVYRRV